MVAASHRTPPRFPSRAGACAFRTRLIVEAAGDVFAARGFQAATVEEIATRAEVAIATLYKLFGSKEAIFAALVEHRQQEFLLEVAPVLHSGAAPAVRLTRFIEVVFRYFEQSPGRLPNLHRDHAGLPLADPLLARRARLRQVPGVRRVRRRAAGCGHAQRGLAPGRPDAPGGGDHGRAERTAPAVADAVRRVPRRRTHPARDRTRFSTRRHLRGRAAARIAGPTGAVRRHGGNDQKGRCWPKIGSARRPRRRYPE